MKQSIVECQRDDSFCCESRNEHASQDFPEFVQREFRVGKEAVIGIVGSAEKRIGQRNHSRYRAASRAENPAGYEFDKNFRSGPRENREKLLKDQRPCRYVFHSDTNLSMHIAYTSISSAGWFFYKQFSSKI
jgi:hypothetical protein